MFWKICVSLLVLGSASAAKTKKATCVQVSPMKSFKASSFAGRWFEIKRDSSIDQIESLEGSCTYLNFSVATGNNLTIAFSTVLKNRAVNSQAPVKVSSNGQFDWSLNLGAVSIKLDYTILGTDYTNYAVAYACASVPVVGDVQIVWIYGRARTLSSANLNKAIAVLKSSNIDTTKLVDVTQSGCSN